MQIILFTYSCIIMKTLENDNNRGHNNGCVPQGQYMHVTISALSGVTGKCVPWPFDKRFVRFLYGTYSFCPLYIRYSSVSWPFFPLVDRSLSATCPVRMRYSCVLCASYTFGDDLHRHRDDFHHRINIFCTFSVRSASVNAIRWYVTAPLEFDIQDENVQHN